MLFWLLTTGPMGIYFLLQTRNVSLLCETFRNVVACWKSPSWMHLQIVLYFPNKQGSRLIPCRTKLGLHRINLEPRYLANRVNVFLSGKWWCGHAPWQQLKPYLDVWALADYGNQIYFWIPLYKLIRQRKWNDISCLSSSSSHSWRTTLKRRRMKGRR